MDVYHVCRPIAQRILLVRSRPLVSRYVARIYTWCSACRCSRAASVLGTLFGFPRAVPAHDAVASSCNSVLQPGAKLRAAMTLQQWDFNTGQSRCCTKEMALIRKTMERVSQTLDIQERYVVKIRGNAPASMTQTYRDSLHFPVNFLAKRCPIESASRSQQLPDLDQALRLPRRAPSKTSLTRVRSVPPRALSYRS